jgi:hypothetical protein
VPISRDKDGAQVISVPSGIHRIQTDFVDTPARKFGKILFVLGLSAIVGLTAVDFPRVKKWSRVGNKNDNADALLSEAGDPISKGEVRKKPKTIIIAIVVLVFAIAALIVAGRFASSSKPATGQAAIPGTGPSEKTSSPTTVGVGSEVRLHLDGPVLVPLAVDQKALDELVNMLSTKNGLGMETLIQSGRVFEVENDTRARIVEVGFAKLKVRILEGPHVTMDGWLNERWVR